MAFNINVPGPALIDTSSIGRSLSELGSTIGQIREDRAIKEALANLQSDDPASVDEAIRRLNQTGATGRDLALKLREQQDKATSRVLQQPQADYTLASAEAIRGQEARAQERMGWERKRRELGLPTEEQPTGLETRVPMPRRRPIGPMSMAEGLVDVSSAEQQPAAQPEPTKAERLKQLENELEWNAEDFRNAETASERIYAREKFKALQKERMQLLKPDAVEEAEAKTLGKTLAGMPARMESARNQLSILNQQEEVLKKQPTGFLAPAIGSFARGVAGVADQLGINSTGPEGSAVGQGAGWARDVTKGQEIIRGATSNLLFTKLQGFGKGITNDERREMANVYAAIPKSTEGNLALIAIQRHSAETDIKVMEAIIEHRKAGKPMTASEITELENRIRTEEGKKALDKTRADAKRFGIKTKLEGEGAAAPAAPRQIPRGAIEDLRRDPSLKEQFIKKFGQPAFDAEFGS